MVTHVAVATKRSTTARFITFTIALTTLFVAEQLSAQGVTEKPSVASAARSNGTIRGTVFDSLTMSPASGALVWIASTSTSTVADSVGKFVLENVPAGSHQLLFSSSALDSTGLGSLGHAVDVTSNVPVETKLSTPSFQTLWRSLCSGVAVTSKDSGIVWGTIRDANADVRLNGAAAVFRWYDLHTGTNKKLQFGEELRSVRTDSIGNFYGCGLPTDIAITTQAAGERAASGALEHVIGLRRVVRMDLSVSTDMVLTVDDSAARKIDSSRVTRVRGTSTLRGIVRDEKGKPMAGATVTLATADTSVRSNSDGSYVLTSMPAGTHAVQARQIGFRPVEAIIDLRPGSITQSDLQMYSGQELATFNVRADSKRGRDRAGYLERRRSGFGYAIEGDFSKKFDVYSIFASLPGIVLPAPEGRIELMMGAGLKGDNPFVTPETFKTLQDPPNPGQYNRVTVYVDGLPASIEQLRVYKPEFIRAIEFYPSRMLKPFGFSQGMDGSVMLVWTKNAKW